MDVREMLRQLQLGRTDRAIARALGINRKTVSRYRAWAAEQELLCRPLPSPGELQRLLSETLNGSSPPQNESAVEPFRELVRKLRSQKVEMAAIHQRLRERGYTGSYSSVRRYVRRLEPRQPQAVVRIETKPGEEGQVDFGYAGKMLDDHGVLRKAWAFVMTLCWSRHQYVEFVFDQKVETWLRLHRHAFAFFAGVPERIVPDNLKAAIARACWHEPQAQQAYRECAEHYGFLIDPCQPGKPEHKGKVEQGGVHYVKRNFLGGREPTTVVQANQDVRVWANTTAGQRIHGTTRERPLARFAIERDALRALPATAYDPAAWKRVKLHRDCHIVFDKAYYSAPFPLIGQHLWARGGAQEVQIYNERYELVATHTRAQNPGERVTNPDHLPEHKVAGMVLCREQCRQQAAEIGAATQAVVDALLDHRPEDRLRTAGRLLRLGQRFGPERLEAACRRALRFDDVSYLTIKHILEQGLDGEDVPATDTPPPGRVFARAAQELVGYWARGASWN
jgi:transposase